MSSRKLHSKLLQNPGNSACHRDVRIKKDQRAKQTTLDLPAITPLVANHMVHHHGGPDGLGPNAIRRLARRLAPATIDELALVMRADSEGRPPLHSPETLALIDRLRARATDLALGDAAPRAILQGRHLIATGLAPGPDFKALLAAAFEAQLDGAFVDEATALIWLSKNVPPPPPLPA